MEYLPQQQQQQQQQPRRLKTHQKLPPFNEWVLEEEESRPKGKNRRKR